MTIGLEAKGYRESETRAGKRHRNSQKVAKRDERAQELSHKAGDVLCASGALAFLKEALRMCTDKPLVLIDKGPWYRWAFERLGLEYRHERFGMRNKKEKSKPRHMLGIEQGNIPIQLDLWGNEVIFKGKGQTTLYGYPRPD
jgi:hypothetical protein